MPTTFFVTLFVGHLVYGRVKAEYWCKTGFSKYITLIYLNPDNPPLPSFQKEYSKTVKNRIQIYVEVYYWYINPLKIYWANSRLFQHALLRTCRKRGSGARGMYLGYRRPLKQYPAIGWLPGTHYLTTAGTFSQIHFIVAKLLFFTCF